MRVKILIFSLLATVLVFTATALSQQANRITILVDAFGKGPVSKMDWGYSALVEYNGKRILFDTGNSSENFAANVQALGADLKSLDLVVISHRHGDHTAGLRYLLAIAPGVKVFTPADEYFSVLTPRSFFQQTDPSLPSEMRYFSGAPPEQISHGSSWGNVSFTQVDKMMEAAPGITVVPTTSRNPEFVGLRELSLSIQTPNGQIVVVGCSHAGIEQILEQTAKVNKNIRLLVGGLHLLTSSETEVDRVTTALHDTWRIHQIAPGHCTGEKAFAMLRRKFGEKYIYAGVRSSFQIP